jgi:hypothetical protein
VDNSKQQQFNQWSDGHANSAETTVIAQLVTFTASAMTLVPSTLSLFDERFSDVNAPMSGMALARAVTPVQRDNR